ncbi:MAG: SAM-dependent methyltransferase [Kutzneria sp.]|nr:SAM-dependent methyltransferase [Kutzneria sp.]
MTQLPDWVPPHIDMTVPSIARMYDYMLGGGHNFAADRDVVKRGELVEPGLRRIARLNRSFLRRAVLFMVDQGIRQFLDIGSGVPTVGQVHEIAQKAVPECRVLYVDRDAIAVAHSELILAGTDHVGVLHADMRNPEAILDSDEARRLLDFDEPIGLLFLLMLHWVPDEDDPHRLLATYRDALVSGSHLAITHATDDRQPQMMDGMVDTMHRTRSPDQARPRSYDEVHAMFGDFELVEPGLVGCGTWRPGGPGDIAEDAKYNEFVYAGVARKS